MEFNTYDFVMKLSYVMKYVFLSHCFPLPVKLTGKLHDGTIFAKKGHDEEPFEFKIDEGNDFNIDAILCYWRDCY